MEQQLVTQSVLVGPLGQSWWFKEGEKFEPNDQQRSFLYALDPITCSQCNFCNFKEAQSSSSTIPFRELLVSKQRILVGHFQFFYSTSMVKLKLKLVFKNERKKKTT